jgi:hypothetical protein
MEVWMKQVILFEILKALKSKPNLMRKMKVFAIVGGIGFFVFGSLAIWAGISAFNFVVSSTSQAIHSPVAQGHVESLKAEIKSFAKFQPASCWGKAQSLLMVQPWLERPALDNLMNLKMACFEQKPKSCQEVGCEQMKYLINTAEGGTI